MTEAMKSKFAPVGGKRVTWAPKEKEAVVAFLAPSVVVFSLP